MQNIVTWGQNMSANIEEFACISMGRLFSGVPPQMSNEEDNVSPTNFQRLDSGLWPLGQKPGGQK